MSATQEILFEQLKELEEEANQLIAKNKDATEQFEKIKLLKEQLQQFSNTKNLLKG